MEVKPNTARLIAKSVTKKIKTKEKKELDEWIASSPKNKAFFDEMSDPALLEDTMEGMAKFDSDASWKKFEQSDFGKEFLKEPIQQPRSNTGVIVFVVIIIVLAAAILVGLIFNSPFSEP